MFGRSQWCIALEFDPDRFLDERHAKYLLHNPFIFLPFNAGWYTFTQWHDRLSLCYPIRTSNMSRPTICLQRNFILPHPTTPNIFLHLACQRRTAPRYAPSGILEGVRRSSGYRGVHGAESFSNEYKSKLKFMAGSYVTDEISYRVDYGFEWLRPRSTKTYHFTIIPFQIWTYTYHML